MNESKDTPEWFPDYIIYSDLQKNGLEQTAEFLINKVKQLGGQIDKNPLKAKAIRLKRKNDFKMRLESYLGLGAR